jgi:hypothetical protein
MPDLVHLRVHGYGQFEVKLVAAYLTDLRRAYYSIIAFEQIVGELPFAWSVLLRDKFPSEQQIALLIPKSERLILSGVLLESPGFWEFLGSLTPFEVLRKYLNDRHERRKDREYREPAERERLRLENMLLQNEVIAQRIEMARRVGRTDRELAPVINKLLYEPLTSLDRHQDRGVIEDAELYPKA